jgi:hypothetical protein
MVTTHKFILEASNAFMSFLLYNNHFKMAEAMELKIIATRSPSMASYQISYKSNKWFRSYYGGQTDRLISFKPSLIFGK